MLQSPQKERQWRRETLQHQATQARPGTTTAGIVDTETLQSLATADIIYRNNACALRTLVETKQCFIPKQSAVQDSCAVVREFADSVQNQIHNLLPDGVVPAGKIIGRVFLSAYQLLRVEELAVGARAHLVHHRRFLKFLHRFDGPHELCGVMKDGRLKFNATKLES